MDASLHDFLLRHIPGEVTLLSNFGPRSPMWQHRTSVVGPHFTVVVLNLEWRINILIEANSLQIFIDIGSTLTFKA